MPRQHDLVRRGAADRDPLRGLDWQNIDEVAREAGQQVHEFIKNIRDGVIEWIKETTGIDLSGLAEFGDAIFDALAAGLNLSAGGAAVLALLEGLVTLDPRSFLDQLAGLFNGGAGLELPDIFTGLGEMFAGLNPDGGFDASKLFGNLPAGIQNGIRDLVSFFSGDIELGQIFRALSGQEKNWLQPFDSADTIVADQWWSWDGTVGRTKLGSAKVILDGTEHPQTSDAIPAVAGQQLSIGGYVRWTNYTGTGGPAFVLRALAFDAGNALIGSQQIGSITPSGATAANFNTSMSATWTAPANTKYVRLRMEPLASATGGVAHFDDLWLRKPAQSLPQEWINGLTTALTNLGQGVTDAWNFVQQTIDNFMNGRGILGSLFSLSHFQDEVAKVFGPGSSIPQSAITNLPSALAAIQAAADGAVDTAENAIDAAAQLVIDGMNNLGHIAGPIQSALESFIDAIFGSGTSTGSTPTVRWSQEVLLAAGPVVTGQNDLPLGFGSPFPAVITSINMVSSAHVAVGSGSRVVVQTLRNGNVIHTATWNGGNNSYASGSLNISGINANDRITFNVTEASSQMANMSITIAGRYS